MNNKQQSFSNFIIKLSVIAVAISTAVMVVSMSLINGFQFTLEEKAFAFWGHIRVEKFLDDNILATTENDSAVNKNENQEIENILKQVPAIKSCALYTQKYGVIIANHNMEGVVFKGYDKISEHSPILSFLIKGKFISTTAKKDTIGNQNNDLVISSFLANRLQLDTGQSIIGSFIEPDRTQRKRKLNIVGIYKTGIEDYDKNFVFVDAAFIQKLNSRNIKKMGAYELSLHQSDGMEEVNQDLYKKLPNDWNTKTAKEIVPNLFDWLNLLNVNKWVLIIILSIVAIVNIIACMITFVLERSRMIGILKSFGYDNFSIQKIFIYYATYVSFKGIIIGIFFGLGICLLQQQIGFIKLDESIYFMSQAPVKIIPTQIFSLILVAVMICFLILILPSYFIQKLKPIKSIQIQA